MFCKEQGLGDSPRSGLSPLIFFALLYQVTAVYPIFIEAITSQNASETVK
jgi:hypothetical protein